MYQEGKAVAATELFSIIQWVTTKKSLSFLPVVQTKLFIKILVHYLKLKKKKRKLYLFILKTVAIKIQIIQIYQVNFIRQ